MTRRLILLRHGKSSWNDTDVSDHERCLNARGQRSADAIGAWMAARGYLPDEVLSSSAARTRETWERIAAVLPSAPEATVLPALYLATPQTLFDVLTGAAGTCVAMVGHNPGIGALASALVAERPEHAAFARYPTLATLVVDFDIDAWSALAWESGTPVDFVVPREFTD